MNTQTLSSPGALARVFNSILLLLACALALPLCAAEEEDPRDFLMMKLYEATLRVANLRSDSPTPEPGSGSGSATNSYTPIPQDYGCKLWLEIKRATNSASNVVVTIHNTVPALNYTLWTKTILAATQAWTWETNVTGTSGQDWTTVTVPMNQRPQLFFFAGAGGFGTNVSFRGLEFTNSQAEVPDTMGAVGPDHFVEVLNAATNFAAVAVYDKCSKTLLQLATNTQFFAVQDNGTNYPTDRLVDATVLYDHQAERWLASALDIGSQNLILAVSQTSSPLDLLTNWNKFLLRTAQTNSSQDYPRLGLDAHGVYLSLLNLASVGGQFGVASTRVIAIHKPSLYNGTLVATNWIIVPAELDLGRISAILPVVNFDAAPRAGYAWFVAKQKWEATNTYLGGALRYRRLQWSGTNASWADTNWVFVPNSPAYRDYFDLDEGSVSAPQTNSVWTIDLHRTGSHLMSAVMRDGALWTCQHIGLSGTNGTYNGNESGTNVDRSAVQWIRLSTDTNGQFLAVTSGRIYDRSTNNPYYYFFPSLMVNKAGDMVAGFSGSKATEHIGAFYSWRKADGTTPSVPSCFKPVWIGSTARAGVTIQQPVWIPIAHCRSGRCNSMPMWNSNRWNAAGALGFRKSFQTHLNRSEDMKRLLLALILVLCIPCSHAQGTFFYFNPGVGRTRIGSLDGALASTNILGQMLIGQTPDSLVPFGTPLVHDMGIINGGFAIVPGISGNQIAYMQLVAWDSLLWGSSLANVPLDQLGRTDIASVRLSTPLGSPEYPAFTQPAIVPVPEPSAFALLALGGAVAWALRRKPR